MKISKFENLRTELDHPDSLFTDFTGLEKYCHDATEQSSTPGALLLARTKHDIVHAVQFCEKNRIPIVPRGAGTGLSGGCIASSDAFVLSTELLVSLSINADRQVAYCGPGALTKTVQDEALKYDLAYPPDPASYAESTLGGNVAEGAGGLRCKRYGVTKDYVLGLEMVTASGIVLKTGILNDNRGFCLGDLMVASEGTLAIITEIAVRLTPVLGHGTTILAAFDNPENAARTVSNITSDGIIPTVMEYIDGGAAEYSNAYEKNEGLDKVAAILLFETSSEEREFQTRQISAICNKNKCSYLRLETDPIKAEALWNVRRNISKAVKEMTSLRISEDVAVPNTKFPDLIAFVSELNDTKPIRVNSYGHAGDGNLHVNFLSMTDSSEDREVIEACIDLLMRKTIELGGTITGEHGVGLAKKKYMQYEFDENTLKAMKAIKELFDPRAILNPGKIFPD